MKQPVKNIIQAILFIFTAYLFTSLQTPPKQRVFTSDIDNFWIAYDSVRTATTDSAKQLYFINSLYINKGTEGLKAFIKERDYSPELFLMLINKCPKFWNSIRANTLLVKSKAIEIDSCIDKFKILYPELKESRIFFTIGGLRSEGTTNGNLVLIGTEMAVADSSTDISEFQNEYRNWLGPVFKMQSTGNILSINIHEYVHTQQNGESSNLLGAAIIEGSCDFISELVIGKQIQRAYIDYGRTHEKEIKEKFKLEMHATDYSNWLYNGNNDNTMADLGYFIGYQICKYYYEISKDKKAAIKQIIELNYSDTSAVESFLKKSKYYTE
jgi:hypothetical protein